MSRVVSPLLLAALLLLSACGLGLEPMDTGALSAAQGGDPVSVDLAGRTYAVPLSQVTVLEPAGLQAVLPQVATSDLLFHVSDEATDTLDLVMSMAAADGAQDPCQPVYSLPAAAWRNPELDIQDGTTRIDIAGQPLTLSRLNMQATVSTDGGRWDTAELAAFIDTRDLLGGSLPEGTDICGIVENMGGTCEACDDGVEACSWLRMELQATETDISYDPSVDAHGC